MDKKLKKSQIMLSACLKTINIWSWHSNDIRAEYFPVYVFFVYLGKVPILVSFW